MINGPRCLDYVIETRGIDNLIICTIEEMSELTKVLTKRLRNDPKFTIENLTEEMAHVYMMIATIQEKFDINDMDLRFEMIDAINRCKENDNSIMSEGEIQNGSGKMV